MADISNHPVVLRFPRQQRVATLSRRVVDLQEFSHEDILEARLQARVELDYDLRHPGDRTEDLIRRQSNKHLIAPPKIVSMSFLSRAYRCHFVPGGATELETPIKTRDRLMIVFSLDGTSTLQLTSLLFCFFFGSSNYFLLSFKIQVVLHQLLLVAQLESNPIASFMRLLLATTNSSRVE